MNLSAKCMLTFCMACAGSILLVASAGGLFPMPPSPVYAASKVYSLAKYCKGFPVRLTGSST